MSDPFRQDKPFRKPPPYNRRQKDERKKWQPAAKRIHQQSLHARNSRNLRVGKQYAGAHTFTSSASIDLQSATDSQKPHFPVGSAKSGGGGVSGNTFPTQVLTWSSANGTISAGVLDYSPPQLSASLIPQPGPGKGTGAVSRGCRWSGGGEGVIPQRPQCSRQIQGASASATTTNVPKTKKAHGRR